MHKLAIFGGTPIIEKPFAVFNTIDEAERNAVNDVLNTGVLSKFLGSWGPDFYGGTQVQHFEQEWAEYFNTKYAVSVNSATSGLIAAIGALGLAPGDEVIVTTWTMCASATAILVFNAIPVFADIEPDTYNIDLVSLENNITKRTKAIMVADIFGHGAQLDEIMAIARKYQLKVIEDASQAPSAKYKNRFVGTIADIGVFSLNYHKHIHTGEGGMCVTDQPLLAERLQLIRNHGEAVVAGKYVKDISNIIGFNFRMGEIEAAIGRQQLKKLPFIVESRQIQAQALNEGLTGLEGLILPLVKNDCTHVYYIFPLRIDPYTTGVSRTQLVQALKAEGIPGLYEGYNNCHLLPMYQQRIAYGSSHFPWVSSVYQGDVSYNKGICPTAERLHDYEYMSFIICLFELTEVDIQNICRAFRKVWKNRHLLKRLK